jgi:hypothetical protein
MGNAAQLRRHATEPGGDEQVDQSQDVRQQGNVVTDWYEGYALSWDRRLRASVTDRLITEFLDSPIDLDATANCRQRLEAYFPFGKPSLPPTPKQADQMAEGFFASDRKSRA